MIKELVEPAGASKKLFPIFGCQSNDSTTDLTIPAIMSHLGSLITWGIPLRIVSIHAINEWASSYWIFGSKHGL